MIVALLALCTPNFLLGLILILVFSGRLQWFPTFGVGSGGDLMSIVHHATLPALALGASAAGVQARMVRSSLIEALSQDYVRTARAKGLAPRMVLVKHALRNAMSPVVTLIGIDVARLLTGTVIIETMFARRGVGKLLVDAIYFRDYPQIQGTLLVFIAIVIVANTLTDVAYTLLDPRVRYE
jgi:peptide/nickel transport system permease protein